MAIEARTWTEIYHVRSYEVDPSGQASLQTLCNYVQEAAANHAQALGFSVEHLAGRNLTWVLSRLHVQIDVYPQWRDVVHVETWPSGENGLYATREFLVRDGDGRTLGRASSAWLLLDLGRRRPIRIPRFFTEQVKIPDRAPPLPDAFDRLPQLTQAHQARRFYVRYSDLDVNRHVNNVRYVEWAVESVAQEAVQRYRPRTIEIHFRAETVYGDTVIAQVEEVDDGHEKVFVHRLLREHDAHEVATARTKWRAEC